MKAVEYRRRMDLLADKLTRRGLTEEGKELHFLADCTRRRKYIRKKATIAKVPTMTPYLKRRARELREGGMSYHDIGQILGVTNVGRISEACTGIAP